jgi:hypothetical protein
MQGWEQHIGVRVNSASSPTSPAYFGAALRAFRLQHGVPVRTEALDVLALAQGNSSMALVCAGLAINGYQLEMSEYRDIESGLRLPEDPTRFLKAFSECLALSNAEVAGLLWQFAYEILRAELGEKLAREVLSDDTLVERPRLASDYGFCSRLLAPLPSSVRFGSPLACSASHSSATSETDAVSRAALTNRH